jgi:hypothetical protein
LTLVSRAEQPLYSRSRSSLQGCYRTHLRAQPTTHLGPWLTRSSWA